MKLRKRMLGILAALFVAASSTATHAAPSATTSGALLNAPRNPHPGIKRPGSPIYVPKGGNSESDRAAAVRALNAQPAILGAADASNGAVVFTDASNLPNPPQQMVLGLPTDAIPHGVGYFGSDNALISDSGNSRIFVVKISTAQLLATIDTSSSGYNGGGTIAIAPNLSAALAMGHSDQLYVVKGPFNASSDITSLTMPGRIENYQTQAIVFNNAGRAFVYNAAGISVLDAPYTSIAFTIPVAGNDFTGAIAISPDGNTLLTTTASGNQVNIFKAPFSASTTSTAVTVPNGDGLDGISITPNGTKAIVVSAFAYHAAAISAPFNSSSIVEDLPLPVDSDTGFEDVGISADGTIAILTGNAGASSSAVPVFIRAPFTAAGAQSFAVPIDTGNGENTGRGSGAVRFLPPGLAPGLTISKSAPASVESGANLTYTLTYRNTGTANATNVIIRDPLPTGTTFVSATGGGTFTSGKVVFNIGTVNAGAAAQSVSFTVRVTAGSGSINNNNYTIEGTGVAPIPGPPVTTQVTTSTRVSLDDLTVIEGNTGTTDVGSSVFWVHFSQILTQDVTLTFQAVNGTAVSPTDYTAFSGDVLFEAGGQDYTISNLATVFGDTAIEPNETFTLQITKAVGATIADGTSVVTIINDDAAQSLSISDVQMLEGDSGYHNMYFTVSLNKPATSIITVNVTTAGAPAVSNPATPATDFVGNNVNINFAPGQTAVAVAVPIAVVGDTIPEADENFAVSLTNPVGATIAKRVGIGTIVNDDGPGAATLTNVTLAPDNVSSVVGAAQRLVVIQRDSAGHGNIKLSRLLLDSIAAPSFLVQYDAVANKLYLRNDANSAFVGGFAPGSANVISNTKGSLDCANTQIIRNGKDFMIIWALIPKAGLKGTHDVKLYVQNKTGLTANYEKKGTWTVN